jgi:hypothetical protein
VKLSFAPKAILESIAEEQEAQVPRDFAEDDQPVDVVSRSTDEPIAAETPQESGKSPSPETEAEADDKAARTLH